MDLPQSIIQKEIQNQTMKIIPKHNGLITLISVCEDIEQVILNNASATCNHYLKTAANGFVRCVNCSGVNSI